MEEKQFDAKDKKGNVPELVRFEDVVVPAFFLKNVPLKDKLEIIKAISYEEKDVMICSFPKTGTHWVTNLVTMLQVDANKLEEAISVAPLLVEVSQLEEVPTLPKPRVIVTHLAVDRIPTELRQKAKVIVVLRNPKDTCVSMYHHMKNMAIMEIKQPWESFIKDFLHGPTAFGPYDHYLKILQTNIETDAGFKPCILYFENLKKDGVGELRKLQEYLGLSHPDSHLEAVLNKCDINKLRDDVNEGRVQTVLVNRSGQSILYRKGEIGDWKNNFTVAQNEYFEQVWSEKTTDSIFTFQYE